MTDQLSFACFPPGASTRRSNRKSRSPASLALIVTHHTNQVARDGFTARELKCLAQQGQRLSRVYLQSPSVAPLVTELLLDGLISAKGDLVREAKRALFDVGVSDQTWRLLAHGSERFFWQVCHMSCERPAKTAIAWCQILTAGQATWEPPPAFVEALFASAPQRRDGKRKIDQAWWTERDLPILRGSFREGEARHMAGKLKAFVNREMHEVDAWWRSERPVLDSNQQKAGWQWLLHRARAWRSAQERKHEGASQVYRAPLDEYTSGALTAKALRTSYELWLESVAMHNCVDDYAEIMGADDHVLYSVRDRSSGRRMATVELRWEGDKWSVEQIASFANRPASLPVKIFAENLAADCSRVSV